MSRRVFVLAALALPVATLCAQDATPIPKAVPVPIPKATAVDNGAAASNRILHFVPSDDLNEPGKKEVSTVAKQLNKRAIIAMGKGDLATAREDFLEVLQIAPGNVPTLVNLGLVEYRSKNMDEAEKRLLTAVHLAPENSLGWLILGVVQYDESKLDWALASLAQAVVLDPKSALAHQYLGVTIGQKGWYSGAEDEMRKAIELDPEYAEAHFNLAVFYLQRNPPAVELARRHYQRALELGSPPDPDVERSLTPPKD